MFVCLCVCLSVCLYVCLSVCLYVCMFVCVFCLFVCLSICLFAFIFIRCMHLPSCHLIFVHVSSFLFSCLYFFVCLCSVVDALVYSFNDCMSSYHFHIFLIFYIN